MRLLCACLLFAVAHAALRDRVSNGLILYLPFTEGSGTVVSDRSSDFGATDGLGWTGAANLNRVRWLSGSSGIEITSSAAGESTVTFPQPVTDMVAKFGSTYDTEFTLEVWAAPFSTAQDEVGLVSVTAGGGACADHAAFRLVQKGAGGRFNIRQRDSVAYCTPVTASAMMPTEHAHHIVVTVPPRNSPPPSSSSGNIQMYVNGSFASPTGVPNLAADFSSWTADMRLSVGQMHDGTGLWRGKVYQVAVYGRRLSAAEIAHNHRVGPFNHAPTAAPSVVAAVEDTPVCVPLPADDVDETDPAGDLVAVIKTLPSSGQLYLASGGVPTTAVTAAPVTVADRTCGVMFVPAANEWGVSPPYATFTYAASDGEAESAPATVSVAVEAVNDVPEISPLPAPLATQYGGTLAGVPVDVTDVDGDDLVATVEAVRGELSFAAPPPATVISGDASGSPVLRLRGDATAVTAALHAVQYQHVRGQPSAGDEIRLTVEDLAGPPAAALFPVALAYTAPAVGAAADVVEGVVGGQIGVGLSVAAAAPSLLLTVVVEARTGAVVVDAAAAPPAAFVVGAPGVPSPTVVVVGVPADVNAWLAATSAVFPTVSPADAPPGAPHTVSAVVRSGRASLSLEPPTVSRTVSFSLDTPPTVALAAAGAAVSPGARVALTCALTAGSGSSAVTVEAAASAGVVTLGGTTGPTVSLSGPLAEVNAALERLSLHAPAAAGTVAVTVTAGNVGGDAEDSAMVAVTVIAVNYEISAPTQITAVAWEATPIPAITLSSAEGAGAVGTEVVVSAGLAVVSAGGEAASRVVVSGTVAAVSAALRGATYTAWVDAPNATVDRVVISARALNGSDAVTREVSVLIEPRRTFSCADDCEAAPCPPPPEGIIDPDDGEGAWSKDVTIAVVILCCVVFCCVLGGGLYVVINDRDPAPYKPVREEEGDARKEASTAATTTAPSTGGQSSPPVSPSGVSLAMTPVSASHTAPATSAAGGAPAPAPATTPTTADAAGGA